MGRPSTLTPEIQESICSYLRQGQPFTTASRLSGVEPTAAQSWLSQGRDEASSFSGFSKAVEEAREENRKALIATVQQAALEGLEDSRFEETIVDDGNGQVTTVKTVKGKKRDLSAAKWLLERTYQEEYAPPRGAVEGDAAQQAPTRIVIELPPGVTASERPQLNQPEHGDSEGE